jgi:hypothetical protein
MVSKIESDNLSAISEEMKIEFTFWRGDIPNIDSMPDEFNALSNVVIEKGGVIIGLKISHFKVKLPNSLMNFRDLQFLQVGDYQGVLEEIPDIFNNFVKLETLILHSHKRMGVKLPKSFANLKFLKNLWLSGNFASLEIVFDNTIKLEKLKTDSQNLQICNFPHLKELFFFGPVNQSLKKLDFSSIERRHFKLNE